MKVFELSQHSNICQQMLRNNSEYCNSAGESFNLTTFLEAKELAHFKSFKNDWSRRLDYL